MLLKLLYRNRVDEAAERAMSLGLVRLATLIPMAGEDPARDYVREQVRALTTRALASTRPSDPSSRLCAGGGVGERQEHGLHGRRGAAGVPPLEWRRLGGPAPRGEWAQAPEERERERS